MWSHHTNSNTAAVVDLAHFIMNSAGIRLHLPVKKKKKMCGGVEGLSVLSKLSIRPMYIDVVRGSV